MSEDPYVAPYSEASPAGLSAEERNWAMIAHFSALTGIVSGFGNIVGPLVVWLIKKDSSPFVATEAKEALNFHLTWLLAALVVFVVSIPLMLIIVGVFTIWLSGVIIVGSWVFSVIAGIQSGEGKAYRYPLTIRFIK